MITKQISFAQMAQKLKNFSNHSNALELKFLADSQSLYKDGKTAKVNVVKIPNGVRMRVSFKDPIAYYLPFLEWGTGEYMPDWWKPFKEQGAAYPGLNTRRKPRGDQRIRPRGRGNRWLNFAKKVYPGSKALKTPVGYRSSASGARGKHRLQNLINTFFSRSSTNLAMRKVFQDIEKGSYV